MAGARRRQTVGGFPVGSWGPLGVAAAATANLDLDAQEAGQDTFAAELAVLVQASLQVQEAGADTAAGTASVLVQLDLQAQDGADTAAMAASVQVQADLAAQDAPDTMQATVTAGGAEPEPEPEPAPGGGGGSWGTGPSHRFVTHYAKEYPEDARTPVARAAAEAVQPTDAEVGEQPPAARRPARPRRATIFTPPAPSAEALLLAEVLVMQQEELLLAAQVQADLLAIEALRAAAMAREEEEAIELFLLLEA